MIDEKIFPFLAEKGHVISLVGGGGKTTLMYNLAAHCARKAGRKIQFESRMVRADGFRLFIK